ncbi:heavy-metal-associated domain-containing protein [Enterococcus sp. LJL51]|uniref:heavy-metal-associated domain-containing protein n=1 Tax=Enterococcus sp. LJL51 TaxID=3416656 RepID=UPI003CEB0798
MNQTVKIEGMKCAGCVGIVKEKFEALSGVREAEVNLAEKKAVLSVEQELSQTELEQALAETKFTIIK